MQTCGNFWKLLSSLFSWKVLSRYVASPLLDASAGWRSFFSDCLSGVLELKLYHKCLKCWFQHSGRMHWTMNINRSQLDDQLLLLLQWRLRWESSFSFFLLNFKWRACRLLKKINLVNSKQSVLMPKKVTCHSLHPGRESLFWRWF